MIVLASYGKEELCNRACLSEEQEADREIKRKAEKEESRDVCCKGERERQGKRKVEEEERTNEKRKRREGQGKRKGEEEKKESSSYYKWQSLPRAYDKGLSAFPGIDIPQ